MKDIAIEYLGGSGFLVSLCGTGLFLDASESGSDRRRSARSGGARGV